MLMAVKPHWPFSKRVLCAPLESSADLKCIFCAAGEHVRKVAQLLVAVAFWLLCLHSCDLSSCLGMSFKSMRAGVTDLILKAILAQLLMSLDSLIY